MLTNCRRSVEMDYNDNAENTEIITNNQTWNGIPFHPAGKQLMSSGNDVISNRPIRFNNSSSTDNFIGCDNITSNQPWNMDSSDEKDNQTFRNDQKLCSNTSPKKKRPDLNIEGTKNQVTWQQLSPKKEKKVHSQSSSGSSSSQSSPTRSWKSENSEVNKNQVTWRDISPTKVRKKSPEHVCVSPSKIQAANQNEIRNLQFSPEHGHVGTNKKQVANQNELRKRQCSPEHACTKNGTSVTSNQNEMKTQFSPSHGHACHCQCGNKANEKGYRMESATKRTNQNSDNNQVKLKNSDKAVNPSPEDAFNNDYFYDEDFTVQFDTNLRESSPGLNCTCIDPALMLDFPHMLTGSYLSFNNIKSSSLVDQNTTDIFCPDESELSCSRNSAMDVSTSEREMMCSSDMLDFSDNPIFTPSPTREERAHPEIVSTDSLDKCKVQGQSLELSMSQTSSTGNLCMDCCPRKEAYFLSFDGSGQGRSASTSDIENSTNSFESGQGQARYHQSDVSTGSGEDMEDECSDSFHFCFTANQMKPQNSGGKRFQQLGALHEKSLERSQLSDELRIDCLKKSLSPKKDTKTQKNSANKMCLACSPKKGQGQLISNGNSPSRSSNSLKKSKPKPVTSWKQIKSLRRLGKVQNGFDNSKSNSMPELCLCSWPSISSHGHHDLHALAESFHGKRHSAYLLDLYQRIKNQSNPVSPEAMANIEQILFQPMIDQNNLNSDKGFLKLDEHCCELCKEDSHSSHTLTNSRIHNGSGNLGQHLESATRKRILEWLDKEKWENKNQSKCCQTETVKKSKETVISPVTVTLWCGTKNFGSQFPPSSRDFAIQTSVEEINTMPSATHDAMQQTSPLSERNEILAMLPKDFSELEDILPRTQLKPKNHVPRSKSADDSGCHGNKTLSMQNQNSSFYSHKSLPDLSFLSSKSCQHVEQESSIFDPLPNPMPIPALIPAAQEQTKTRDSGRSSPRLLHQYRNEAQPHCGANHRSRSAPSRLINQNLTRNFAESGSSSSGFSTSSTSSGIDPGYSEPRSIQNTSPYCYRDNTSPCNDIERLLFYPPHVESSVKKDNCCKHEESETHCLQMHQQHMTPRQHLAKRSRLSDKKVNKYANEVFPNSSESKQKVLTSQKMNLDNTSGSSSNNSSLHLEHLYSLQEEQTPVSSPEQHNSHDDCHSNTYCYHDNTYCEVGTYGYCQYEHNVNYGSDWDPTQEVILRRKFDLDIGGQVSSESGSSSSSSLIPNFDRKPLKSCLRKKQFLRSRSMSDPFSLLQQFDHRREARKVNRHSYACEEVYLLTDEAGEYFLYQNDSEAEEPVLFCLENHDEDNTQTVKRRQKNVETESSGEQLDKDLSGKRKSVSFASEVSFHAISPQMSPKRQTDGQDQEDVCCHGDSGNTEEKPSTSDTTVESVDSSDSDTPPTEFQVSTSPPDDTPIADLQEMVPPKRSSSDQSLTEQLDKKRGMLTELSDAAELLLNHFAEAKNPFDKLRLGNSADTPEVGELVLSKLCPLIVQLLSDGLKQYVTGVHVFGRVKVTVWKVAEASAELGPYTRAIHQLVQQLKGNPGLVSCTNKFDAFIFGLLNLRLLDFWIGYIRHNDTITKKYYNTDGVILLGQSYLQMAFDQMLISLQPLAVLPFQLGFEFIVQRSSSKQIEKSPVSSPMTEQIKPLVSPTTVEKNLIQADKNANQVYTGLPPAKPPRIHQNSTMFSATKAWDWLKGSASQESSTSVLPKTSDMMSSITEMFGKLTGKSCDSNIQTKSSETKECQSAEKKRGKLLDTRVDNFVEKRVDNSDETKSPKSTDAEKNNTDEKENLASELDLETPAFTEQENIVDKPDNNHFSMETPSKSNDKKCGNSAKDQIKENDRFNTSPSAPQAEASKGDNTDESKGDNTDKSKGDNTVSSEMKDKENNVTENSKIQDSTSETKTDNTSKTGTESTEKCPLTNSNTETETENTEKAMKRSLTDLAQNLFGRAPNSYKRGATEYNFNAEKGDCKKHEEKGDKSKINPVFTRSKSLVEGNSCEEDTRTEKIRKSSFDEQKPNIEVSTKGKSGIIKLFDKLLLPRQSLLKQPQTITIGKSFSSGEIQSKPIKPSVSTADAPKIRSNSSAKKTKYRWSWSIGQSKNKLPSDLPSHETPATSDKTIKDSSLQEKEIGYQESLKKPIVKNGYGTKLPRQTVQPKSKERRNSYIYSDTKVKQEDGSDKIDSQKGQGQNNCVQTKNNSEECVSLESGPVVKVPGLGEGKPSKNGKKPSKIGKLIVQPKNEGTKEDHSVSKTVKSGTEKKGSASLSG